MEPRVERDKTLLLVIDVQERLAPAMHDELRERLLENLGRLGGASEVLGFPVILTEQYPKGLGPTLPSVLDGFKKAERFEKICFGATESPEVEQALARIAPKTILVAGMETHICVYQSVRALIARGYVVHVLRDAVASRTRDNAEIGLELMRGLGAVINSTETVLFDMLGQAGTEEFKAISRLVR